MTATRIGTQFLLTIMLGGVAFLVDFGALCLSHGVLGMDLIAANTLGNLCGIIISYLGSRSVIFPKTGKSPAREIIAFGIVFVTGVALSNFLVWSGVKMLGIEYRISKIVSLGPVTVWNFALRKWVVFRPAKADSDQASEEELPIC